MHDDGTGYMMVEVLRCESCGALDPGPREICPNCLSPRLRPHQVAGEGVLVSSTVVRRPPRSQDGNGPYAVAAVRLDSGVRITVRLAEPEAVLPGTPMRVMRREAEFLVFEKVS